MRGPFVRRGPWKTAFVALLLLATVSCGTLLYPERRGQPPGRIDPAVVILDGIGLLFFFVPGVIAFAVDFGTGAIYLPQDCCAAAGEPADSASRDGFTVIRVPPEKLTRRNIARVVREHTDKDVSLRPGAYRAVKLEDGKPLSPESVDLARRRARPSAVLFRAQSPR